jgi:hypothetical protein
MVMKKRPAVSPKKKASPPIARPAAAKPPVVAHPRLVHGFLVRLTPRYTIPAKGPTIAVTAVTSAKMRAKIPSNARREGPSDDATFH